MIIKLRFRAAMLLCLLSAAAFSVCGAYKSLHYGQAYTLPEDVAAQFSGKTENAEYYLRESEGFVAVFSGSRERTPISVTHIETSGLRETDRVLLRRGIPVSGTAELLMLLEDLGS